jgi:hypothetical protein
MRLWTMTLAAGVASVALTVLPCPALACSLCFNIRQTATFRQTAAGGNARLILFGTLSNARLSAGDGGRGETDFTVSAVLKLDPSVPPALRRKKGDRLVLPSYLPPLGPGAPDHYLFFCDIVAGRYDFFRGAPVTAAAAAYLQGALALNPRDVKRGLLYFFRYLDHPDQEVARDAFMEFVKASDREVGEIAEQLPADKLRAWLRDPRTPAQRLGLYAFLLGRHGARQDWPWYETALEKPAERTGLAFDGILSGYIQLRPKEGWQLAINILREGKRTLPVRLAVIRTLRFYHGWKPAETREAVLRALAAMVAQGELADLAVEEMRKWRMWDLTDAVLALYGRKGLDAPLQRRAIVRYALCCPLPRSRAFVEEVRKNDSELVSEIEEGLRSDR